MIQVQKPFIFIISQINPFWLFTQPTAMKDNYDYMSNTPYIPSTTSFRKGSADFNTFQSTRYTTKSPVNQVNTYKKQWDTNIISSSNPYRNELRPQEFSSSFAYSNQYRDVKRLPEEFSSLRQTFDTRGNNRIRDLIAKYDTDDSSANTYTDKNPVNGSKYDKDDNMFYSPKGAANKDKYKNTELDEKLKKYSNTVDKFNDQLETTNKMSEEIKKLKEDRRRRLEAKQKQLQQYSMPTSYSSTNLTSSYKSPTSNSRAYNETQLKNNYEAKETDAFRKRKTADIEPYTPKYTKKVYEEVANVGATSAGTTGSINLQKYKNKIKQPGLYSDSKASKYDKYEKYQFKPSTTATIASASSTYTSKTPSSKKISQPVQYVEVNNFILGKSLGEGKFGVVYQAFHKPTGWLFAIKKVPKQMIKSHLMVDQFILELKLQTFLYHENILSLYTHFDDKNAIYLVLQYMEQGTLFTHLKKNKTLPEVEVAMKIKQIASAVKYLHENQIAHRDIKPQNIVMSHGVCKLCDFGWATICSDRRKTYCGTFDYAPPEILEGVQYDYTVDLWCLGVLTYELLVGKAPFYHISRKQTMKKIINVEKTTLEYPQNISKTAVNFIDNLIKKDPKERLSSQMLLEHPFLKYADKKDASKN